MAPKWTIQDSLKLYQLPYWGRPFFSINEAGNITVRPKAKSGPKIDLREVVEDLSRRGIKPPVLLRFNDILGSRMRGGLHPVNFAARQSRSPAAPLISVRFVRLTEK